MDDGVVIALTGIGAVALAGFLHRRERRARTPVEVGVHLGPLDDEQREHVLAAQRQLRAAGIGFDTGYDLTSNVRDWEWDWSLSGPVEVTYRRRRR